MSINAVERALIILKQLAYAEGGTGVREMARNLGISPGVVQKSLQALVVQGFAEQDPTTQHYYLGPAAIQVGLAGLAKLEIRQVARPYMEALAERCGETTILGLRQGNIAVYIDKVVSREEMRVDVPIGSRRPLNCTAVGKVILAYLPDEEIERLSHEGVFVNSTPQSITDLSLLKTELAQVRAKGFAFDNGEFTIGMTCLAAPVRDHDGGVIGAITVSGPVQRMDAIEETLSAEVIHCANEISTALGYRQNRTTVPN